jgi:tetratricopeptide (TPR) repeat protein
MPDGIVPQDVATEEAATDLERSARVLEERVLQKPDDIDSRQELGRLLSQLKRPDDAASHFRILAEAAPQDLKAWLRLARALSKRPALTTGGRAAQATEEVEAWRHVAEIAPDDPEPHQRLATLLYFLRRPEEAAPHVRALAQANQNALRAPMATITHGEDSILFEQDGQVEKTSYAFYRGEHTHLTPTDRSFGRSGILADYFVKGLMPKAPLFDETTRIVAFGSCFASHISAYLDRLGYYVATKRDTAALLSQMGDGIVNSYAVLQQFEWAWRRRQPAVELWHDYDAKALGYDEEARLATELMFDSGEAFIITLGLSEVWYDEPTGEVFWRAVPHKHFDPGRHKFRVATYPENLANLKAIHALIRERRPDATIIFTLSPIALAATFRPIAGTVADTASKAILRAALDAFFTETQPADANLYYFPSYEIALRAFEHPLAEDRRHVHNHVLDLNMAVFERYFCKTGLTDEALLGRFRAARAFDARVMAEGHSAVPRGGAKRAGDTFDPIVQAAQRKVGKSVD